MGYRTLLPRKVGVWSSCGRLTYLRKKPGKQVAACSTLKWFVRSMECFNTSGSCTDLEKRRVSRVRRFLATVRKALYPDIVPKGLGAPSSSIQRHILKRDAKTAGFSASTSRNVKYRSSGASHTVDSIDRRRARSPAMSAPRRLSATQSRRRLATVRGRTDKSSARLIAGECLQCSGDEHTVVTATDGGRDHMLQRTGRSSRSQYEFDDDIPSDVPVNYRRLEDWEGDRTWVNLIDVPPHCCWGGKNKVHHIGPWLRGMGVQNGHRSFLTLTTADLERNRHAVYLHAPRMVSRDEAISKVMGAEVALWYLGRKRAELDNSGYCILEGFFQDDATPSGTGESIYNRNLVSELFDFYEKIDHEAPTPTDPNVDTVWWEVKNDDKNNQGVVGKHYITSRYRVMEFIEKDGSTSHLAAVRAALDIRALQICHSLGLENDGHQELAIPLSGSRIMTHSEGVKRQIPHTDFEVNKYAFEDFTASRNASYSVIWAGEDAVPLFFGSTRISSFKDRVSIL